MKRFSNLTVCPFSLPRITPVGASGTPLGMLSSAERPQSSFVGAAAAAAAAEIGPGGAGAASGGGLGRSMISVPSFTSLRELWGQLPPEEVQERISLAGMLLWVTISVG